MHLHEDFITNLFPAANFQHKSTFSAPSNIALVKYWGKNPDQTPANPSISFTLNNCKTITSVEATFVNQFSFDFYFEGERKPSFLPKLQTFFDKILPYCSFLNGLALKIDSKNTFPHSSGIASSASALAALAMNICDIERKLSTDPNEEHLLKKASFLARIGSGSACRSISGNPVIWGKNETFSLASDLYGIDFQNTLHPIFENYQDTILLVDVGQKVVSSTAGHALMNNHPFAASRFEQAHHNLALISKALEQGDLDSFIQITESEALTLHAMMLTSTPSFILMHANTLQIIERVRRFRESSKLPVCFTLDAGANVHLLYPESIKSEILEFIKENLVEFCQNQQYLCDTVGNGAQKLN